VTPTKTSMKLVLDPRVSSAQIRQRGPLMTDYVAVPRLETYGTYRVLDMLSHESTYALLTAYNRIRGIR